MKSLKMKLGIALIGSALFTNIIVGCKDDDEMLPIETIGNVEFANGLKNPIGMALDDKKNLWVTETGTGNMDSQVTVITPQGQKYVVIEGFHSKLYNNNYYVGLNHLLINGNTIWLLHDEGYLYHTDISGYIFGSPPLKAENLLKQDISTFVEDYDFEHDTNESNPFNMAFGPGGDIYIADAGANAIIKRSVSGKLSVVATIPGIPNPMPMGPPTIESVPTGIVYDGNDFLISTLLGFPFPGGHARVYKMDANGTVTLFQEGFNSLSNIAFSTKNNPVVLEYASFVVGAGWKDETGKMYLLNGTEKIMLKENLNLPTAVANAGNGIFYVNSFKDGKVFKLTTVGT